MDSVFPSDENLRSSALADLNVIGLAGVAEKLEFTEKDVQDWIFSRKQLSMEMLAVVGRIYGPMQVVKGDEIVAKKLGEATTVLVEAPPAPQIDPALKKAYQEPANVPAQEEPVGNLADGGNVCLLFPIHDSVSPETFATVLRFVRGLSKISAEWRAGDSEIARSRNHLAKRFLNGTAEWSIWIDDDMVLPCGSEALFRVFAGGYDAQKKLVDPKHWSARVPGRFLEYTPVSRLTSHGKTIVSACYWDRWGKGTLTAGYSQGIHGKIPVDSLHPVDYTGFGCIAIHRRVYEDIARKFPEVLNDKAPGNECGFFTETLRPDGSMRGEDEAFCWRAKEAGHPTYLDLAMVCGHVGRMTYGLPEV